MKTRLLTSTLFLLCLSSAALAQENLSPDQNPNYAVSLGKYMAMADSINQWHGTTVQQTYKAYDWYEQKQERRRERILFERALRLERARSYGFYPGYYRSYGNRYHRNWWSHWCF